MKNFMKKHKLQVNGKKLMANSKRVLALLLAVAMVTGGMPASTAYAAENTAEAATEAVDVSSNTASADATTQAAGDAGTTDGSEVGEPAEIILSDLDDLDGSTYSVQEVNATWVVSRKFDEAITNPFESFVESLENGSYISVEDKDGVTDSDLRKLLQYQWQQKGADGSYANMADGTAPYAAGEYRLVLSIEKKYADAEPVSIDFVIEKKELYVTYDKNIFNEVMDSGNTVKEVKEALAEAWGLANTADGAIVDHYKVFANDPVISVKGTYNTAEALADDAVLKKGDDYSVWISVALKEQHQANYELVQLDMINLRIEELVDTELVIINNRLAEGADLIRHYNGEAVADPTVGGADAELTVKVISEEIDPATGENIEITPAEGALTFYWTDANGVALESAPTEAGAYYYRAVYTDAEGIYDSASARIRVIVEPKTLVLRPAYSASSATFAGSTVNSILRNVTYNLYEVAADGTATEFTGFDKDTFWGVSYNNPTKVQSYSPVFALQMGQTTTEGEGENAKTTTVWSTLTGVAPYPSGMNKIDGKDVTISYRIVFTGTKGLFEDGVATDAIDINTVVNHTDTNYVIDTTALEADANVVTLDIMANANAVIDVTAMLKDGKGDSASNAYTKVYDGLPLYTDRAEYKKAVVRAESTKEEIAKDTDSTLAYSWYTYKLVDKKDETTGEVVKDEAGNPVKEVVLGNYIGDDTLYNGLPQDAGKYCLVVTYKDPTNQYAAKPAYVYFDIQKQLVMSVISGEPVAYTDTTVRDFKKACPDMLVHKLYLVPGNDRTLTVDKMTELTEVMAWNEQYPAFPLYAVDWVVLAGDNTDPAVAKFEEAADSDVFKEKLLYKVGAEVRFLDNILISTYYKNFTNNYEVVEEGETVIKNFYNTLDINVKKMGDTELELRIDEEKRGEYRKTYDGTGFDITAALTSGYVTLVEKDTDKVVPIVGEGALDVQFTWKHKNSYYNNRSEVSNGVVSPAYAREYTLYISFAGNDTYRSFDEEYLGTYTIEKRDLVITPVVNAAIPAGIEVGKGDFFADVVDMSKTAISGYVEADAEVFYNGLLNNAMGLVFDNDFGYTVYDKDGEVYTGYLRTGKTYGIEMRVRFANEYAVWERYTQNYNIVPMRAVFGPNVRGNSKITDANAYYNTEYAPSAVTVTPLTALPYWNNRTYLDNNLDHNYIVDKDENRKMLPEGNYFEIHILAPEEFKAEGYKANFDRFVFKNAVADAGGYVTAIDKENGEISLAFPAEDKTDKSFVIHWEEGYTETYTVCLAKAELMVDVRKAVAPKSLSFNGANKKMMVGETQQLDVKISRVLSTDVVLLNYEVISGTDVMSVVKDTGVVTALKPGTATVAVYPVRFNQNGGYERIDEFKKSVTVKIKVSNVSAPKITSVKPADDYVEVYYKVPTDGYRREVYVLPGKGLKAADFESKIAAGGNADFAGVWYYSDNKYYAGDIAIGTIGGLQPNTDYTVYVRNVSAIRETADGQEVVASAAGTVKSFKTTKRQIEEIELRLADASQAIVQYNLFDDRYDVPLSAKSFKVDTWLLYAYKDSQAAADYQDGIWLQYALSKQDQMTYLNPKMEYFVIDYNDIIEGDYSYVKTGEYKCQVGDRYYKASKLATIDKKGTVKLKGLGVVTVWGRDTISNKINAFGPVNIYADVTKMTAKKLTVKEGSAVDLYNYLIFNDGKTKLTGVEGLREQHPIVVQASDAQAVEVVDGYLLATQPNKKLTLTISLANNPSVSATMQVTTKAMDSVKGMKVIDITDIDANVTFTHTGNVQYYPFDSETMFKVNIQDNKGRVVDSFVASKGYNLNETKRDLKKNVYAYELELDNIDLYRQSNYTVSIAPMFRDSLGKAVSKKFKTTNIPASRYTDLGKYGYGGVRIYEEDWAHPSYVNFISGNTYTLYLNGSEDAENRMSDKLTWKSSNKKVATVKANTGTFSATFKALKPGTTDIEVTSKITKKVIARWTFVVIPVGNGVGSYGSWEPVDFEAIKAQNGVEPLSLENPARFYKEIRVDNFSNKYRDNFFASFTAPYDGTFTFTIDSEHSGARFVEESEEAEESVKTKTAELKQGESIELTMEAYPYYWDDAISFSVSVAGTKAYNKLTMGSSVISTEGAVIRFVAPADNFYTFCASVADMDANVSVNGVGKGDIVLYNEKNSNQDAINGVGMKKGDIATLTLSDIASDYEVSVKGRVVTALSTTAKTSIELKKGEERWFSFTAPVGGTYTFASENANGALVAEYYNTIMEAISNDTLEQVKDEQGNPTNNFKELKRLDKGDRVVICITTESETAVKADISVSQPVVQTVSLGQAQTIAVEKDGEVWVSFEVPVSDTEYCFDYAVEEGKTYTVDNVVRAYHVRSVTGSATVDNDRVSGYQNALKKGDVIYVKLTVPDVEEAVNVTVNVTATTATALVAGTAAALTAEDNGLYFYTFEAPSYGLYTFEGKVAEVVGGNNHQLSANRYNAVDSGAYAGSFANDKNSGFYAERVMTTGEEIIFAVAANDLGDDKIQTKADILVTKVEPAALTEEAISLEAGVTKWFKYTATYEDTYTFNWNTDSTASVYKSATLDANMSDSCSNGYTTKLFNGSSIYFKLTNDTNALASIKFAIDSETPDLTGDAVNMKADDEQTYKFVVGKEGRYKVSIITAADGQQADVWHTNVNNNSTIDDGYEFFAEVGETHMFRVKATTDATVTVKVELIAPADLTADVIRFKADEVKYFQYTIPATGRYNAKVTDAEDKDSAVTVQYMVDEMDGSYSGISNINGDWFTKGQVIYLKMTNGTTEEATAKVAISQIQITDLVIGAESSNPALKAGDEKWYRFRADEKAYYTFTAVTPENDSSVKIQYYIESESDTNRSLSSGTRMVNKNVWYDIKITRSATDTDEADKVAQLGVKKESFITFTEKTDLEIKAKDETPIYAKFDVPATAFYSMVAKELPKDVEVKIYPVYSDDVIFDASNLYAQENYEIGDTEYYKIILDFESENKDEEKTVKLYIDRINPPMMENSVELTVNKGMRSWFAFKAPEAGRYTFSDNSQTVNVKCYGYIGAVKSDIDYNLDLPEDLIMAKDDVIYFAAYYTEDKNGSDKQLPASATFTITVKKAEAKAITGSVFNDTVAANSANWYSFTSTKFDDYQFAFKKVTGSGESETTSACAVNVYSNMLSDQETFSGATTFEDMMNVGDVWYFRVVNNSAEALNFRAEVTNPAKAALNIGSATPVTFTESGSKWLNATVSTEGYYEVKRVDGNNSVNGVTLYNGDSEYTISNGASNKTAIWLETGDVLVCVEGNAEASTILEVNKVTTVSSGTAQDIVIGEDGCAFVEFKYEEAGYMAFNRVDGANAPSSVRYSCLNGTSGSIYSGSTTYGNNYSDYTYMRFVGDSVLVKVTGSNGSSTTVNVRANATYPVADLGKLNCGGSQYVALPTNGGAYFTFTAPAEGTYEFYSTGSYDTWGFLYDAEGNYITRDDQSGGNGNYRMTYELEKGETVRCYARYYYRNSSAVDFTVCVDVVE